MAEPVELELRLRAGTGGGYFAEMRAWLNEDTDRPFEPYPVRIPLAELRTLVEDPDAYGERLTRALFENAKVLAAFTFVRARVKRGALRLRIWVAEDAPELHLLRWELLRDPDTGFPLASSETIYFSRYLPPAADSQPLPKPHKGLNALAAAGAPLGLDTYGLTAVDGPGELRQAGAALVGLEVTCLPGGPAERCTLATLVGRLRAAPKRGFDVLYLACHGLYREDEKESYLLLEDDGGQVNRVTGSELAEQIASLPSKPRLVVLASCDSAGSEAGSALTALGPRLVQAGVPAVIAMQGLVQMETAAEFVRVFFEQLNRHGRIDRAAAAARAAVRRQPDWWSPVLFMCLRSGRLWKSRAGQRYKPTVALVVPNQIPAARAYFTGRVTELEALAGWVAQGAPVINIFGIDGLGKTTLALELSSREKARFPGGILYLDMLGRGERPAVSAEQALAHVIQSYHPSMTLPSDTLGLEAQYRKVLQGKRALIVLDNIGDETQIAPLLPPPDGCLALITSWRGMELPPGAQRLPLGKMNRKDAVDMLLRLAPNAGDAAGTLVEKSDFLPQVIASVARLLQAPNLAPDEVIDLLENAASELGQDKVDAALKVSYEMLDEQQQRNWRRLAVFAGDFPAESAAWVFGLLTPITPRERYRTGINFAQWRLSDLLNYGLVDFERETDHYALLNAARRYALSLLAADAQEEQAARLAHAQCCLAVLEQANQMYLAGGVQMKSGLALYDHEQREVRAAWDWINAPGGGSDRLSLRARFPAAFVELMVLRMTPAEVLSWLETGLTAARQLGETALQIRMLGGQGTMHYARHSYPQALECYQTQLGLARSAADCDGLVYALGNLGAVYRAQGFPQRALRYFNRQLELARRFDLPRQQAAALGNLGRTYTALNDLEQAITCYEQDLALSRASGDRRGEAIALGGLGNVYRLRREFPRALQLLENDLSISREIGDQHGAALASWMMGQVYEDMGDPARAAEWMQVLVTYERDLDQTSARRRAARVEGLRAQE